MSGLRNRWTRVVVLAAILSWPSLALAQPAPTVATTVRTTDTTANSVRVGCTQVGSCTGGIVAGPIDVSSVTSAGFIGIASNVPVSTTMRLYNNAGTLTWNGVALATGSSLSGTIGTLAKFTAADAVGDSICSESGTTITCVNTVSATTLTGTLSTATQNSVTTMTGLTTVGTIGTGVWQGTLVGLTYGGTGANLSGTGGTSQFLRQNTLGGVVTVVRPAVSDLSDAANVALLNASNTFTGALQTIDSATNAYLAVDRNATSNAAAVIFQTAGTPNWYIGTGVYGTNTLFTIGNASNAFWGVNTAGDWTFGASSNVMDSAGTPTITSDPGSGPSSTIAGSNSVFTLIIGAGAGTTPIGITFGGSGFTNAPVCLVTGGSTGFTYAIGVSTTTLGITPSANWSGTTVYVHCRGY